MLQLQRRLCSSVTVRWPGIVIGKIHDIQAHPMADKLKLCQVLLNETDQVQIICGATNVALGQHVPVATIGARIHGPEDKKIKIKKSKLRGEFSHGMICSKGELGLQDHAEDTGIMVLPSDTIIGTQFDEFVITS